MHDLLKTSFDKAKRKDVVLSLAEVKELEGCISSCRAITSWLDLWLMVFGRSSLDPTSDVASVKRVLKSGSKALFFLAQQINNVWFNLRLKRRNSVLEALTSGCTPEEVFTLRNSIVDGTDNLFLDQVVREFAEGYHSRMEKAAIRKAVSSSSRGKKKPSPKRSSSSESGCQAKIQKPAVQVAPQASADGKDSHQSFPKNPWTFQG